MAGSALEAEATLLALVKELDRTRPGAAASLREGLDETLTVLRLGVPPTRARPLRSTNAIESDDLRLSSMCEQRQTLADGRMALRWCAAGMVAAGRLQALIESRAGEMSMAEVMLKMGRVIEAVPSTAPRVDVAGDPSPAGG